MLPRAHSLCDSLPSPSAHRDLLETAVPTCQHQNQLWRSVPWELGHFFPLGLHPEDVTPLTGCRESGGPGEGEWLPVWAGSLGFGMPFSWAPHIHPHPYCNGASECPPRQAREQGHESHNLTTRNYSRAGEVAQAGCLAEPTQSCAHTLVPPCISLPPTAWWPLVRRFFPRASKFMSISLCLTC
jgi:hypothetical protein